MNDFEEGTGQQRSCEGGREVVGYGLVEFRVSGFFVAGSETFWSVAAVEVEVEVEEGSAAATRRRQVEWNGSNKTRTVTRNAY